MTALATGLTAATVAAQSASSSMSAPVASSLGTQSFSVQTPRGEQGGSRLTSRSPPRLLQDPRCRSREEDRLDCSRDQLTWPPSITSTDNSFNQPVIYHFVPGYTWHSSVYIHIDRCIVIYVQRCYCNTGSCLKFVQRRDCSQTTHASLYNPRRDYRVWHRAGPGLTAVVGQPCLDAYCMYTHYPRRVAHLYDYAPLLFHVDRRLSIRDNRYRYTEDLLALERSSQGAVSLTSPMSEFLPLHEWSPFFLSHPDQRFAAFMRRGISFGFRIGYDSKLQLRPPPGNFRSVVDNPDKVSRYIAEEVSAGRLQASSLPTVRKNPIGLIPKPHQPGKFRLIVDLSAPCGFSVNDGIAPALCSLEYISVDEAARMMARCGRGALMAKTDLKSAYRHVPVHPADQHLLGLEWNGTTYLDRALPFGLRSAPKLFTAVADGLSWALYHVGVHNVVHYLDDFLLWGPSGSPLCAENLQTTVSMCERLGLPVAPEKTVGPTTAITFLGIELDSVAQEVRLPAEKLARLRESLSRFEHKRHATKHELQVLIGILGHAAAVVRPGRVFLRQLIDTSKIPRLPSHKVRLNAKCCSDLAWWSVFVQEWNGVALFPSMPTGTTIFSDASGSWGCGAFDERSVQWFQLRWPASWSGVGIAVKELFPIVVCAAVWGRSWRGSVVTFRCDNGAVVSCLTSRTAREPHLAHLLRCLFFFQARFNFEFKAQNIAGRRNTAADALSRNKLPELFSLCPQAQRQPTQLPSPLTELLSDSSLNWTSPRWKGLFETILRRV